MKTYQITRSTSDHEELEIVRADTIGIQEEGFIRLASAVVYRAALDARHQDKLFVCRRARWWLLSPESEPLMELVGLDVQRVRERLARTWMGDAP